jgi:hypothetical protein
MTSWAQFAQAAPALETAGRRLISRAGDGSAFLATVRGDGLPRINPVTVEILEGRLISFVIVESAKFGDLTADGRYALHAYQDPAEPNEFQVRGRAHEVTDPAVRAAAVAGWSFEADDSYRLFEFSIDHAVLGERASADDWPPVYSSWRAPLEAGDDDRTSG